MKKLNKILSIILAILMVISIIPLTASAEKLTSGTYGDITWTFDESTGTLTISGTGKMYDDVHSIYPTWHGYISSIESVVISEGVTTISDSAFCNNENIKNVSIADSVTDIGDEAFYNCTDLTNVVIGDGVTTIGYRAFYNCDGLTDVVIGKGVTVIGDYAFNACSNLKTVTIYNAVETIGEYSFNCPKLTDVYYLGTEAEWNAISKGSIIYGIITGTGLEKATIHFLGEETHECSYNAVVTAPTCTEQGYTTYTCVCGDSYVDDYVDATGHNYSSEITVPATHTATGVMTYTCTCGDSYTEVIEKLEKHNYESVVTAPTCTEQGYTTYTCECGDSYVDNYVDATGHSYDSVVTPPTCTEQGYTIYTCECGDSYIDDYVDALGHTEEVIPAVVPTCTETGLTDGTKCSVCGEILTEQKELPVNGHTPATAVEENYIAPTCTENGSKDVVVYCSVCEEEISRETVEINATGHNYTAVTTAPTCTEQGYTTFTCECGESYVGDYVDALGHTSSTAVEEIHIAPTCTENGSKDVVVYCSVCEEEISRETVILDATGHSYTSVTTAPTCTERGYTTYTCDCGETYVDDYINATGHADNDGDGYCDECDEELEFIVLCDHNCHKGGISGFFWKISNFFNRIFGLKKYCECGAAHY